MQPARVQSSDISSDYKDALGRTKICYNLSFHMTATLISGYSINARYAVIQKLSELAITEAMENVDFDDTDPEMYVYAMREVETGRIKLGISRDPGARLKQLQTGNSQRLELVAYRKASASYQDEKALHLINADCHIRGEWFNENAKMEVYHA